MISVYLFFTYYKYFLVLELPVLRNGRIIRLDKVEIHPSETQIWHNNKNFIFPMTKSLTDKGTVAWSFSYKSVLLQPIISAIRNLEFFQKFMNMFGIINIGKHLYPMLKQQQKFVNDPISCHCKQAVAVAAVSSTVSMTPGINLSPAPMMQGINLIFGPVPSPVSLTPAMITVGSTTDAFTMK
jgi:hypothetical protein